MALAGGIAVLNAAISLLIVALATPGSGVIGAGFQVIVLCLRQFRYACYRASARSTFAKVLATHRFRH